jgi:hypothetical protein
MLSLLNFLLRGNKIILVDWNRNGETDNNLQQLKLSVITSHFMKLKNTPNFRVVSRLRFATML